MKTCQTCGVRKFETTDYFGRLGGRRSLRLDSICRVCRRRELKFVESPTSHEKRMRKVHERYLSRIETREAYNIRRRDAIRNDSVLREEANRKNREYHQKTARFYIGGSR